MSPLPQPKTITASGAELRQRTAIGRTEDRRWIELPPLHRQATGAIKVVGWHRARAITQGAVGVVPATGLHDVGLTKVATPAETDSLTGLAPRPVEPRPAVLPPRRVQ